MAKPKNPNKNKKEAASTRKSTIAMIFVICALAAVCIGAIVLLLLPEKTEKAPDLTSSTVSAPADFKGDAALTGRWKCMTETQNGVTRDASGDEIYYVFAADGTLESYYQGSNMGVYSGYTTQGDRIVLYLGSQDNAVTLKYEILGNYLTLSKDDGSISTVYEKVE